MKRGGIPRKEGCQGKTLMKEGTKHIMEVKISRKEGRKEYSFLQSFL
jgi:hypothetical protein